MASSTKLSFRARNLDANKPMAVYFVDELPDLSEVAPINRAVAQMPTGMEKDEEMESHLQDAILAQQASTSGVAVENHVIPTPKVHPVENDRHRETYQVQPQCPNNLIRVQAWRTLDQEEPSYDIDSDDEQWLEKHPNVAARDLEKIFEVLEMRSSDNQICLPDAARSALSTYDENVIDDSYDYWLTKRKELTSKGLGAGGLIPRVRTEAKKDGTVNPYVAFRRRAEKMQTRKNRKNDEESYEKVLRIGHDLRRCVTLADLIKKREKMKSLLLEGELEIFRLQLELSDFDGSLTNHFMQSLKAETANGPLKEENGAPKKKLKKKKQRVVAVDREIPNKAWLKKNAEVWNMPPSMSGVFSGVSPIVEVDKSGATQEEEPDGPFVFRRRKHCIYRSARNSLLAPSEPSSSTRPLEDRFFQTEMPSKAGPLALGFTRRRLGRGGRVMFDRLVDVRNANRFDPFLQDCICDDSVSFRGVEAEPVETPSVSRSASPAFSDREQELAWMASARSPTPTEDNSMPSSRPSPSSPGNYHNGSGNGLMGRVGHTDEMVERVQMPDSKFCQETASCRTADEVTVTCETEMSANSDYWTAGDSSRSPSESNSSMDWTPPSAIHRGAPDIMSSFVMLSREEEKAARTGDHPRRQSKPAHSHHIAKSVVASTVEGILKHTLITPAPSVG